MPLNVPPVMPPAVCVMSPITDPLVVAFNEIAGAEMFPASVSDPELIVMEVPSVTGPAIVSGPGLASANPLVVVKLSSVPTALSVKLVNDAAPPPPVSTFATT